MRSISTQKRKIAIILLLVWFINLLVPSVAYALTSGPTQPETKGFQPAGVSDMVDVQTGSFKYNIPLLDIDGYPINLNYQSGIGMDDEASWVGLGWSLNPGAINRQVRGIPDDMQGDLAETDHYTKPKVTVGGKLSVKVETLGIPFKGSASVGIFSDNYTGIGAELGINAGLSFAIPNAGFLTANLGAGILSNTQGGLDLDFQASVSPMQALTIMEKGKDAMTINAGLSGSLGYNTRSGLKSAALGTSFTVNGRGAYNDHKGKLNSAYDIAGSSISFNTEPISPSIQIPYTSRYDSFSFDVGLEAVGVFPSEGGSGYRSIRQVKDIVNKKPAYGFLYAEQGKYNQNAVMDFIREKDNPIVNGTKNIAIPIPTPDLWSYTSQVGGGQFRLYRGSSGAFFDNQSKDESDMHTAGADYGVGAWFHGGVTHFKQETRTTTGKWKNNNYFLKNGDFQNASFTSPGAQHVYFRQVGEKSMADSAMYSQVMGTQPLELDVHDMTAYSNYRNKGNLYGKPIPAIRINKKQPRQNRTVISYLTANEAKLAALDTNILNYDFNTNSKARFSSAPTFNTITRVNADHKAHHISEMTITDDAGKRSVYGIPVYNKIQDEYTFAVGVKNQDYTTTNHNQVDVPSTLSNPRGSKLGIDNFYQRESKSPYATSFLLTAILSPDYVDKTGDGITADDLGTAIKFNYSKVNGNYKWRAPYQKATLNQCLLADPDDDKASIIYGEKELWYVSSIESKTKIAYFITEDRRDGLGALNWQYGGRDTSNKQKLLKEIRYYSKADMSKPIKVVKFGYTYELCKGIPNSMDINSNTDTLGGKLTLTKVWFEYGNSDKGQYHPYAFSYKKATSHYASPGYDYMVTDRWGTYKPDTENLNGLTNEQYPYSNQDTSSVNQNAALWHLNKIELPTGGTIDVNYESGDYSYVQDKKAMVMVRPDSLIYDNDKNHIIANLPLNKAKGIRIKIDGTAVGNQTQWFKNNYLNGSSYIYTKLYVQIATDNSNSKGQNWDYVPCYCEIDNVTISGGYAYIIFKNITESKVTTNPISIAAWQKLKNDYPRYAYPGFDNRVKDGNSTVKAAISAIVNAAKNLSELFTNFYKKANRKGYASNVDLTKSYLKIAKVNGFKLGGGVRVKTIRIYDNWDNMSNNGQAVAGVYGQAFDYTTIGDNNQRISSGVATYEPAVGNDENALKEPIMYNQHIRGGINNFYDIEKPFCESLYPAPSIGYSKVTVKDLDSDGNPSLKTGYVENEFYTAKDFPVKVNELPLINHPFRPAAEFSLTESHSIDEVCLSQGYSIELNDMQGKPLATRVFSQSGAEISSTVYGYNLDTDGGLNNNVPIVNSNGQVANQVIGRDIEFFTDFREQESKNMGQAVNIGGDVIPAPWVPPVLALPHNPVHDNNDYKLFRSACALKVIQTYGILNKVTKTQNGSSIATENIAYDGLTGEALVTKTQNEFKKDIYAINMPAYWAYMGMGPAYKNMGILLKGLATNPSGEIRSNVNNINNTYLDYLQAGDEIVALNTGIHYWVIENKGSGIAYAYYPNGVVLPLPVTYPAGNSKKLINRYGKIQVSQTLPLVKIVRSGFRNMLGAGASSIICLNNPIVNGNLQTISNTDLTSLKVINASASNYDEQWAVKLDNSSQNFFFNAGSSTAEYNKLGTTITGNPGQPDTTIISNLWGGAGMDYSTWPIGRAGIWLGNPIQNLNAVMGFETCINNANNTTKTYYLGYAGDNYIGISIDNKLVVETSDYYHWVIKPFQLTPGKHTLHVEFYNKYVQGVDNSDNPGFGAVEVYDNTRAQLSLATSLSNLNVLFSTEDLIGNPNIQSFQPVNGTRTYHFTNPDGSLLAPCDSLSLPTINPYMAGLLGNWRPYQSKVFQQSRNYNNITDATQKVVDVKTAGYVNLFFPYWYYDSSLGKWVENTSSATNGQRWITTNTVTLYDKYGQQLENKDALGRYSAAKFDFNGELPAAVASNAMNREVYANSFEDNKFMPAGVNSDAYSIREFIQPSTGKTVKQLAVNTVSHSGRYSSSIPSDGLTMTTIVHSNEQKTSAYFNFDAFNQYITLNKVGLYPNGFEPAPYKKYIFNAWVNDNHPDTKDLSARDFNITINGTPIPDLKCKAMVEGWKLVEGSFNTGASLSTMVMRLSSTHGAYIDDIRMHPFNSHMKTYAYDDNNMRLMAEMDENGFATFYEYDDEGLLVRVKKETDRGIMTLKESRSSYKQKL